MIDTQRGADGEYDDIPHIPYKNRRQAHLITPERLAALTAVVEAVKAAGSWPRYVDVRINTARNQYAATCVDCGGIDRHAPDCAGVRVRDALLELEGK